MIASIDSNRGLGYKNNLLFKHPLDLKHFKDCTIDNTVIMGKNTFLSLNSTPLTRRNNYIISSGNPLKVKTGKAPYEYSFYKTIGAALERSIKHHPKKDIYIIGGQSIYEQFLPIADEIILSEFDETKSKVDTWFPELSSDWLPYSIEQKDKFRIVRYKKF